MLVQLTVSPSARVLFSSANEMCKRGMGSNARIQLLEDGFALKPSTRRTASRTDAANGGLLVEHIVDGRSDPFEAPDKFPLGRYAYEAHPAYGRGWLLLTPSSKGALTFAAVQEKTKRVRKPKEMGVDAEREEAGAAE